MLSLCRAFACDRCAFVSRVCVRSKCSRCATFPIINASMRLLDPVLRICDSGFPCATCFVNLTSGVQVSWVVWWARCFSMPWSGGGCGLLRGRWTWISRPRMDGCMDGWTRDLTAVEKNALFAFDVSCVVIALCMCRCCSCHRFGP